MLTDAKLRAQVDALWNKLWSGGLSNPLDAIEQLSYLLFLKRLDDEENRQQKIAILRGFPYKPRIPEEMRWRYWTHLEGASALKHLHEKVFPWFRTLGSNDTQKHPTKDIPLSVGAGVADEEGWGPSGSPLHRIPHLMMQNEYTATVNSFELYMKNAELKINKAGLLIEACKLIEQMEISAQNQDVQGDLYEYLLGKLSTAGRNGQFRTPRHIIRMMVQMIAPKANERIGDLAAGTGGFLVNAYQYILETKTAPETLTYDADGWPHHLTGELLTDEERTFLHTEAFRGYDNDSGMTMLRIGSMNLMLHGIAQPRFYYMDTLSKDFNESKDYDVILMNPPFKGAVDANEINPTLATSNTTKSELLFLHVILRVRVSTAILFFTRGGTTDRIWFYDMEHDGLSLDDKRQPVPENDIPDILACWQHRNDKAFQAERDQQLKSLREHIAPLKVEKLKLQAEINRLTFESVIAPEEDGQIHTLLEQEQQQLAELQAQISPLQWQINQLTRQFWITKEQTKANKYDLSASRYRLVEQDETYYESPAVTTKRLLLLEQTTAKSIKELEGLLK